MQSLNRIHVNSSTRLSLNDRFTIMKKVGGGTPNRGPPNRGPQNRGPASRGSSRGRSLTSNRNRSRSRSRSRPQADPVSSLQNRNFLAQLDRKHKMRAALQIKRVRFNTKYNIYIQKKYRVQRPLNCPE